MAPERVIPPTIMLNSGKSFNFLCPEDSDFTVEDIARGLANTCRFAGQTTQFYSVAQHSLLVSAILPAEYALDGLFHDAAEAFIGDIPTPLKQLLPDYQSLEKRVEKAIFTKLGISGADSQYVKTADRILLATEQRDLMPPNEDILALIDGFEPLQIRITPVSPQRAYEDFMYRYGIIMKRRVKQCSSL